MIQFNIHRFGKLAKWSLRNDKRYYVKSFLQMLVTLLLVFLFFTLITKTHNGFAGNYGPCIFVALAMIVVTTTIGPAFMFYSMEGKHDMQSLMMLPASNFEKYMMRYSTWIILLPLYMVAFFAADLLQYAVHWVLGHDYGMFVTSLIMKFVRETVEPTIFSKPRLLGSTIVAFIWLHSVYALGATFFRSRKFNWVMTTVAVILVGILVAWLTPEHSALQYDHKSTTLDYVLGNVIHVAWILLNFWLSYKLFCRTQVIGKIVNI